MPTNITIAYPKAGTAVAPRRLPHKFVAVGAKRDGDRPVGLLVSTNPNSHRPDGKVIISGRPIPYKKKDPRTQKLVPDPGHWAFYFRVNGAKPDQLFSVVVFDVKDFTDMGGDVTLGTVRSDFLVIGHEQVKDEKPKDGGKLRILGIPASGEHVPANQFFASVELPAGDYDIDTTTTKVCASGSTTALYYPDWSWPDGDGFCTAFFPTIERPSYPALVDVKVFTLDSGDPQPTNGIYVDAPS